MPSFKVLQNAQDVCYKTTIKRILEVQAATDFKHIEKASQKRFGNRNSKIVLQKELCWHKTYFGMPSRHSRQDNWGFDVSNARKQDIVVHQLKKGQSKHEKNCFMLVSSVSRSCHRPHFWKRGRPGLTRNIQCPGCRHVPIALGTSWALFDVSSTLEHFLDFRVKFEQIFSHFGHHLRPVYRKGGCPG